MEYFKKHQRVFIIVGIAVLLGATSLVVGLRQNKQQQELASTEEYTLDELSEQDSDGDGIPDWEEILIGLNPLSADSNADGISDFDILTSYRSLVEEEGGEDYVPFDELPRGEQAIRQTYAASKYLESIGELTPEAQAEFVDKIYDEFIGAEYYKFYSEDDIKIAAATTANRYRYYEKIILILSELDPEDPNALFVLKAAVEDDEPLLLEQGLLPLVRSYEATRDNLLSISVYPSFITPHLALVNSIERVITDAKDIQGFFTDPIAGYGAAVKYSASVQDLADNMASFAQAIENAATKELNALNN